MSAQYGLIGYPLGHSFSPAYFAEKFAALGIDAVYSLFPIMEINEFPALIQANYFSGLNVTIPYKESIIKHLDELDETAANIGAVNCISFKNGVKKGYNTDATGFEKSLLPLLQPHHTHALVLGTGGSSKTIAFILHRLGITFTKVSRSPQNGMLAYNDLNRDIIAAHTLIINCTPLGKYPNDDTFPLLPYESITGKHLLYDLVYNPRETQFLQKGKAQGAAIKNGYEMLLLQADAAWNIWNR